MPIVEQQPFKPSGTVALAATDVSSRVALGGAGEQVRIANKGPNAARVVFGGSTISADSSDMWILPNSVELHTLSVESGSGTGTYAAALCDTGETANLTLTLGTGGKLS